MNFRYIPKHQDVYDCVDIRLLYNIIKDKGLTENG